MARENTRLVYSSDTGRMCPDCGRPARDCACRGGGADEPVPVRVVVKMRMERAGRGGKTVTVLYDLPRNGAFLKELGQDLKKACGVGGAVQDGSIELQGDQRDRVREWLIKKGYGVRG